jgi:nitrite reductase (NO-forming)
MGRRHFLRAGSAAAVAALLDCTKDQPQQPPKSASARPQLPLANSDVRGEPPAASPPPPGIPSVPYTRYAAELPPLEPGTHKHIHMSVRDVVFPITKDIAVPVWTFDGTVPGPVVRTRVGDIVDFTLTNNGTVGHSMDFHAAQINPKSAFRSISPGQSLTFTFTPKYAGAFMYHCGTGPVLMHIGMGMFGAIIVDPPRPLPAAREFVLVEGEYYLNASGPPALDYSRMLGSLPDHVVFNGHPFQYMEDPLRAKRGDLVRIYLVNAGPSQDSAFHIVGEQFDTVYVGAPPQNAIHGLQTYLVAAGSGMIFEFIADVAGEFPFVNHKFGHGQKGAIGVLLEE